MKSFVIIGLFTLLFSLSAEVSFAQAVGGSGSGGGGLIRRVAQGCAEGARSFFTVNGTNDHPRTEVRVCRNGTYMNDAELAAYVRSPNARCKEGARSISQEPRESGDGMVAVLRICVNGKYVRAEYRQAGQ